MELTDFWVISWPQIKGKVCLKPNIELHPFGLLAGQIKFDKSLELERYAGHKWMDFVTIGDVVNYVVSKKVVDLLIDKQITGWTIYDVEINDTDLIYHGFQVTGKAGSLIKETTKLSFEQIEILQGGGWTDWVDGFCIGVGTTGGLLVLGAISLTGVGTAAVATLAVGCGGYGIYRYLE